MSKRNGLNLNSARAMIGSHVNLHLKDGSVVINVQVVDALRGSPSTIRYKAPTKMRRMHQVPLRDVDWLEPLNPFLFTLG